jgi:hypothetical protein
LGQVRYTVSCEVCRPKHMTVCKRWWTWVIHYFNYIVQSSLNNTYSFSFRIENTKSFLELWKRGEVRSTVLYAEWIHSETISFTHRYMELSISGCSHTRVVVTFIYALFFYFEPLQASFKRTQSSNSSTVYFSWTAEEVVILKINTPRKRRSWKNTNAELDHLLSYKMLPFTHVFCYLFKAQILF